MGTPGRHDDNLPDADTLPQSPPYPYPRRSRVRISSSVLLNQRLRTKNPKSFAFMTTPCSHHVAKSAQCGSLPISLSGAYPATPGLSAPGTLDWPCVPIAPHPSGAIELYRPAASASASSPPPRRAIRPAPRRFGGGRGYRLAAKDPEDLRRARQKAAGHAADGQHQPYPALIAPLSKSICTVISAPQVKKPGLGQVSSRTKRAPAPQHAQT